ncbi:MAG: serine/threonine protein kinase, partial [Myxococcales bacterium]|nr:serine/threonine protein kinase [Myxococcales bacterium]
MSVEPIAAGVTFDGRYSIEAEIGRGGMGRVYAAVDSKLGRRVAIKVLAPGAHGDEQLRRFEMEARAAASLQQPNIIDVYDIGVHGGEPYIVSELLEGQTLRRRLAEGPLAIDETVNFALQLARGLEAAHANGVVHRDLKPENLFLTGSGLLKILDFGIAKLNSPTAITAEGVFLGTVEYMSPEQVQGHTVDQRSDIFSFGAILYEMICGKPPFRASTPIAAGFKVISDDPEPPPRRAPERLWRIVERCLRKDPAQRFQ